MTSYIYFIQVDGGGPIKIGITRHDPRQRMVKIQSDCPWPVSLIGVVMGGLDDEASLHRELSQFNTQGEWFNPTAEVISAVERTLKTKGAVHLAQKKRGPKHDHALCRYRNENGLTLKDIATLVGVEHATLSRIESGLNNPSPELAKRITKVTGIHFADLRPDLYRIFWPEEAKARELARAAQ